MNTTKRFTGLVLSCALIALMSTASLADPPSGSATSGGTPAGTTEKFDGHEQYLKALEAYRDHSLVLIDPQVRAAWVAQWQHKHDSDGLLDTPEGTDRAIIEMKRSLKRPFDFYLNPQEAAEEDAEENATIIGTGVSLASKRISTAGGGTEQVLVVTETDEGSPAEIVGIKPGDILTAIDGKSLSGLNVRQVLTLLRGHEFTTVKVSYKHTDSQGYVTTSTVDLIRRKIHYKVATCQDLGNGVSCIKLRNFSSEHCDEEMAKALQLATTGRGLILDLRDNRGGWVYKAMAICQMFLPEGTIYVRRERDGDDLKEYRYVAGDDYLSIQRTVNGQRQWPNRVMDRTALVLPPGFPVVVLVNGRTASAAEVLAGVLQFQLHAPLVGDVTRGKGDGQISVNLPNGRRLHVTEFQFLPAGQDINGVGLIPDIEVSQADDDPIDHQFTQAQKVLSQLIEKKESLDRRRLQLKQESQEQFEKSLNHQAR